MGPVAARGTRRGLRRRIPTARLADRFGRTRRLPRAGRKNFRLGRGAAVPVAECVHSSNVSFRWRGDKRARVPCHYNFCMASSLQDFRRTTLSGEKKIGRALLSVTDKTGLVEFARVLAGFGVELVSTGGTARALREAGLQVRDISELTGFPEMFEGRVKTLHPKVHGGILHRRGNAEHRAAAARHEIAPIDMVVVNLYAFEKTAAKPGVRLDEVIENVDIGGPSMVRSAAKNFEDVAIVTAPEDYPALAEELKEQAGALSLQTRWRLAQKAFAATAAYDTAIANTLERATLDDAAGLEEPVQLGDEFPQALR